MKKIILILMVLALICSVTSAESQKDKSSQITPESTPAGEETQPAQEDTSSDDSMTGFEEYLAMDDDDEDD